MRAASANGDNKSKVFLLVCAALAILKAYGTLRKPTSLFVETSVLWAASADAALAATLLMMAFISTRRLLRSSRFSALDSALVGLLTTATLTDATLLARLLYDQERKVSRPHIRMLPQASGIYDCIAGACITL
ncbi:hypothetical protein HPB47_014507 [Ixodes persulcatus]|uniref:Uncharacterized protein n=1 Tax=Ixodes persulcatus TaxID=34615 RepID=A0AC60QVU1_IXOPE|nr:hypothetical protein HPB47_014507 [Ixodes persulcatus]